MLASPVTGLRLGTPDDGNKAAGATQRIAYERLTEGFGPGTNGPLLLAVALPREDAAREPVLDRIGRAAAADPGVAAVTPAQPSLRGDTAILSVIPRTPPQDEATSEPVKRLRERVLPGAVRGSGARAYVGGITAVNEDLSAKVSARLPVFIAAVGGLSVVLLTGLALPRLAGPPAPAGVARGSRDRARAAKG